MKLIGGSGLDGAPELLPKSLYGNAIDAAEAELAPALAPMTALTLCISCLAAQYLIVATLLSVVRLSHRLQSGPDAERSALLRGLEAAEAAQEFGPMLCVLFLAAQMQALHFSHGREDPAHWMLTCMKVATASLLLQTLFKAIVTYLKESRVDAFLLETVTMSKADRLDNQDVALTEGGPGAWAALASQIVLFFACGALCLGTLSMRTLEELLPVDSGVSPAVSCTVNLTLQFFAVHAMKLISDLVSCRFSSFDSAKKFSLVVGLATRTVFFAPMLCMLFIADRVRALQVHRKEGLPQRWAQGAFFVCAYALAMQTVAVVVVPYLPGGDARRSSVGAEGDVEVVLVGRKGVWGACLAILRHAPGALVGGCVIAIMFNVTTMQNPDGTGVAVGDGWVTTPAMPPTLCCVLILTLQFFATHILHWAVAAARDSVVYVGGVGSSGNTFLPRDKLGTSGRLTAGQASLVRRTAGALKEASFTARLCPMMSVLFLGVRVRAQQVTGNSGSPQGWAQDVMCASTALVSLSLVAGAISGSCSAVTSPSIPEEERERNRRIEAVAGGAQAVLLVAITISAAAVCAALFLLTPETAATAGATDSLLTSFVTIGGKGAEEPAWMMVAA